MGRYFTWITRHPFIVLIALSLPTVLLAYPLGRLHIDTSPQRMVIQNHPAKLFYDAFQHQFGPEDDILIVYKADNVFSPSAFAEINKITQTLKALEGVKKVVSLTTIKSDMDLYNEWNLQQFRVHLYMADVFVNNVVSADGKTTGIIVFLDEKARINADRLVESVESVLQGFRRDKGPLDLYQIGMPVIGCVMTASTRHDFETLPPLTVLIALVILYVCFRLIRGAFVPLASVLIALTWTFGLMAWLDISLTVVTMILPPLLIAVGSAYALYILSGYLEFVKNRGDHCEAITAAFNHAVLPTLLASGTTMVGLASLLLNRIPVIQEFALFAALGITSLVLSHFSFMPAVLSLLSPPPFKEKTRQDQPIFMDQLIQWIIACYRKPWVIITVSVLLTLGALYGIKQIQVDTSPISYFKKGSHIKQAFHDTYKHLAGPYPIYLVLDGGHEGAFFSIDMLHRLEKLQADLLRIPGVDVVVSIADIVKLSRLAAKSFRDPHEYYALPEDIYEMKKNIRMARMMGGDESVDHFISPDYRSVNIVLRTHLESTQDFLHCEKQILEKVGQLLPQNVVPRVTGITMVVSHSADELTFSQVQSLGVALGCIFIIMAALFSFKVGFLVMLPNLLPILINFGLMGWTGIHLSVATSLIASIAIGLSVDDTIHYMVRFNGELKKDLIRREAVARSCATVGRPMVFTTLTLCLGFCVLLFSSFLPTAIFGFLILMTLLAALWSDLFFLPTILLKVEFVTLWDYLVAERGKDFYLRIPLFRNLSRHQVRGLIAGGFREMIQPGEIICRQGNIEETMYLILEGKVEICMALGKRQELIASLSEGEVFGEMGLFRACERSATVAAVEPTELFHLNERSLERLMRIFPRATSKFYFNLICVLADRLQQSNHRWMEERRRHIRFDKQVKVRWKYKGSVFEDLTESVSVGGAFINTNQPVPMNSIIEIEFQENENVSIHCYARVVWHNRDQLEALPSGFGVQFLDVDSAFLERLLISDDEK